MKYRLLFLAIVAFLTPALAFPFSASGANKTLEEINVLLEDEKKELKVLKDKIKRQDKLISSVGIKEKGLLKNLSKIDNQIKLKQRELKIFQWNFQANKKKLAKLETNRKANKQKLKNQKILLGQRFREIYKAGPVFPLKVVFSSDNVTDLLQRLKYMELIAEHDAGLMADYKNRVEDLNEDKKSLLAVKAQLVRLEKGAFKKRNEFKKVRKEKKSFLKKVTRKKRLGIQTKKELLNSSGKLNDLIQKLLTKLVSGEGLDISDKKGRLSLPVKGKILSKFGRKKDKQFGSFIVHNGINIKAEIGTAARAVFNGRVLYTGQLEGYGNLVILGHGKNYHSLYGHLDSIKVKQNQVVKTGDIIGLTGDTGSFVGETLYFEIRKNGKPVEPARWFKTARKK